MKTLFKYIIAVILATILTIYCGALMLFASVLENTALIAICVAGAVVGAILISYLISEVE